MAASAGATTAFPKSDSQNSGLVGNIHGQDVEASKGGSGGLVYWAEKGVARLVNLLLQVGGLVNLNFTSRQVFLF